tara:strand:+ start:69 stop:374 length:306 start_codon:yes stop_codon:yes gene_type:complete
MASNKKDIGKLLRKYGYSFPKSPDEVRSFEEKFGEEYQAPKKWPDIKDIIASQKNDTSVIDIKKEDNKASYNLSMAARDGKKISKEDRDQMNKDKRDARKK